MTGKSHLSYARLRLSIGVLMLAGIAAAARLGWPFSPCVFLRLGDLVLACPLGALEVSLAGHTLIAGLLPGFLLSAALIFLLGRLWCGWLCPASLAGSALARAGGFLIPGAAGAMRQRRRKLAAFTAPLALGRTHALGFLCGLLLGAYIFRYPLWSILCPLGVVSRSIIEAALFFRPRWEAVFLLLPCLMALFWKNGWKCACPVGLTHGMLALPNRTFTPALKTKQNCTRCGLCAKACAAGLEPHKGITTLDCSKCLRCLEHCPKGCLKLELMPFRKKKES
ncbi:MAG: 4Fe-4S binding protein [Deltaproteobacteria bacterium]|jgi:ferredoxin-type protein NapH|nr:4Fe-4S binding protein [Deltaproteobacteria bacterium]